MKSAVTILAHSVTKNVVTLKEIKNKDGVVSTVGSFMVEQSVISGLSRNSIGQSSRRIAYITLGESAINILLKNNMLEDGKELPFKGQVCIEETLTPYLYKTGEKKGQKQSPKIFPKGHAKAGEEITYMGQPVYRNTFFTEDLDVKDVFLKESKSATVVVEEKEDAPL